MGDIMANMMDDLITAGEKQMDALFDEYEELLKSKELGLEEISHALTKAWQDVYSSKCGNGTSPIEYMNRLIKEFK